VKSSPSPSASPRPDKKQKTDTGFPLFDSLANVRTTALSEKEVAEKLALKPAQFLTEFGPLAVVDFSLDKCAEEAYMQRLVKLLQLMSHGDQTNTVVKTPYQVSMCRVCWEWLTTERCDTPDKPRYKYAHMLKRLFSTPTAAAEATSQL